MLNDYQLQQGMRRMVFSGKQLAPSLPEFVKLCRTVGHDDTVPDAPPAPVAKQLKHDSQFDDWDRTGNRHFLAFILKKMGEKRCFNERETRILVRFKNLWANQMRLDATENGVPVAEQREVWAECMRRAEEEISRAA